MAVKKQKTTQSTAPKTKAVAKKTAVKKTASKKAVTKVPKKVAAKKPVAKKTAVKKPVKRTTTATPAAKRAPKRAPTVASKPDAEPAVVIPNNMSIRAREKALVLKFEWNKAMHSVAYVSGLCFAIVGSTLAVLSVFGGLNIQSQTAALGDLAPEFSQTLSAPVLEVTSEIPAVLTDSLKVDFTLTGATGVTAQLHRVGATTKTVRLEVSDLLNNKYRTIVGYKNLDAGSYELLVTYTANNQTGTTAHKIASFSIEPKDSIEPALPVEPAPLPATTTNPATNMPATSTPETRSPAATSTQVKEPAIDKPVEDVVEEIKPEPFKTTVEKPISTEGPVTAVDPVGFRLYTTADILSGTVRIGVSVPNEYKVVELYARPLNSLNSQFIGLAADRLGQKQFTFDSKDRLSNGVYEFYATTKTKEGKSLTTKSLNLKVFNAVPEKQKVASDTSSTSQAPSASSSLEITNPVRPVNREFTATDFAATEDKDAEAEQEAVAILERNAMVMEQRIRAYAVARQSGDEMLIEAAKEALTQERQAIVRTAMRDEATQDIADNIDARIAEKIANIQNRVDAFESVRKERSAGNSAIDTDQDGITDFDEINLYKTDPTIPDSDGDGFTDGVEIIRGFDPLNAESEAVIVYESPKESFSLVREDVLQVDTVIPVITDSEAEPPVLAQITGTGIPDSFVTLYIFSSPIVVTVKTDADGSFVYTLDKELEDGKHDVFIALTDNTGSILGQSNPFSFIKEAQAFTPVDAAASDVTPNADIVGATNQSSYGTVVGIGILALGLILIMLGLSLKRKEEEIIVENIKAGTLPAEPTAT